MRRGFAFLTPEICFKGVASSVDILPFKIKLYSECRILATGLTQADF